ncbi:ABC transporter ATP-binding protein [Acetobacteraceae bacterium H6797]|nr:ABC transporter ATP-binding protein [Acetobacteraceae bacterium H6797]
MTPLVEVRNLRIAARNDRGETITIVDDVSFSLRQGEVLALIGESGSGKTTIALSLLGYAKPGCRFEGGSVMLGGQDLLTLPPKALTALRGQRVSYIAQSAAAALNPAMSLMDQVVEGVVMRKLMTRAAAEEKARGLFRSLRLPQPETIGARYPHQVSGGQLQRVMAAMAMMTDPELLILDEPTTALDVTTQVEVLRAFREMVREHGTTAVYVSHDLAVVAQMADQIVVLRDGVMRERGPVMQMIEAPEHPYTKSLLAAAAPRAAAPPFEHKPGETPLLSVCGLSAGYGPRGRDGQPVLKVLRDIDVDIAPGSALGVIGESGSGKSTLAHVLAGLLPAAAGEVRLNGAPLPPALASRNRSQLQQVQIVFQMADTALNPKQTVRDILARPLAFYHGQRGQAAEARVKALLDMVRLPYTLADRQPQRLSGGQKQRVNLARALAANPALLLCDEVTSALDTVVGEAILDLLAELRKELGVALMFISHDLKTVRSICDDVMILYAGQIMELGPREAVTRAPAHPYADLLAASMPQLRLGWLDGLDQTRLSEAAATPIWNSQARTCPFLNRCALRIPGLCDTTPAPFRALRKGASIRCHHDEDALLAAQLPLPA